MVYCIKNRRCFCETRGKFQKYLEGRSKSREKNLWEWRSKSCEKNPVSSNLWCLNSGRLGGPGREGEPPVMWLNGGLLEPLCWVLGFFRYLLRVRKVTDLCWQRPQQAGRCFCPWPSQTGRCVDDTGLLTARGLQKDSTWKKKKKGF